MDGLLSAALRYAEYGHRVFPCVPGGKVPITPNGFKDASSDAAVIEAWWTQTPDANIGIATAGLLVVDVDGADNAWPGDPERSLELSRGVMSRTPRGGVHYIFKQPDGATFGNSAGKLAPKVDTRGAGGYILAPPSVVNGVAYQWVDGELSERAQLSTPPAWVLAALTPRAESAERLDVPRAGNEIPAGQRNATLARLGGAMRRVGMSEVEICAALRASNAARCSPPLPDAEVVAVAASVARYEPDQTSVAVAEDWAGQDAGQDEEESNDGAADPGPMPAELLHVPGFVSDVVSFTVATAFRPQPVLALAGALSLQAVLAARKVKDEVGNRTNLYLIGVAPSGAGKERVRQVSKDILFQAGLQALIGPEDIASDAGLLAAVEAQPALLLQIDEIGRMLQATGDAKQAHLYNIVTALMRLYSSAGTLFKGKAYADGARNSDIYEPCVSLYGTTTPENFYGALKAENLADGLIGRILILEGDGDAKRCAPELVDLPPSILGAAQYWGRYAPGGNLSGLNPQPTLIRATPEARQCFDALAEQCDIEGAKTPIVRAIWARAEEKARRLALIFACSANREQPEIDGDAARWACALAAYLSKRLVFLAGEWIADGAFDGRQKKVIRIIRASGGQITRAQLYRKTQALPMRERDDILSNLLATRQVVEIEERSGKAGRPRVLYKLAG